MITLTITRADGSLYWHEVFNDRVSADAWIAEEQTRPYWDASWTYTITEPPAPTQADLTAQALAQVRIARDAKLASCDWTQLGDAPLTTDQKSAWATYRQALRDLPDSSGFDPMSVTWPTPPGGSP